HEERAPLAREGRDRVRADRARRKRLPDLDPGRLAVPEVEERAVVVELSLLEGLHLLHRPARLDRVGERAALARFVGAVADGRRALLAGDVAVRLEVRGVAAREHRRSGELRVGDLVVVERAFERDPVTGLDAGPHEPPLVPAEEHVRSGDRALDRGPGTVAVA